MMTTNTINQVNSLLAASRCYNRASRTIMRDSQLGQLWSRWGDILRGASEFYAAEKAREEAMIADYENMMAWENMPCAEEA